MNDTTSPSSTPAADLQTASGARYDILPAKVYFCPARQSFHDMATDDAKDAVFTARWWDVRQEFPSAPKVRRA